MKMRWAENVVPMAGIKSGNILNGTPESKILYEKSRCKG
jgi:hypothetical protein